MDLGRRAGVERLVRRPIDGLWSGRGTSWCDCWESLEPSLGGGLTRWAGLGPLECSVGGMVVPSWSECVV